MGSPTATPCEGARHFISEEPCTMRELMAGLLVDLGAPSMAAALDALDRLKAAIERDDPDAWKIIRDVCQGQP